MPIQAVLMLMDVMQVVVRTTVMVAEVAAVAAEALHLQAALVPIGLQVHQHTEVKALVGLARHMGKLSLFALSKNTIFTVTYGFTAVKSNLK